MKVNSVCFVNSNITVLGEVLLAYTDSCLGAFKTCYIIHKLKIMELGRN